MAEGQTDIVTIEPTHTLIWSVFPSQRLPANRQIPLFYLKVRRPGGPGASGAAASAGEGSKGGDGVRGSGGVPGPGPGPRAAAAAAPARL